MEYPIESSGYESILLNLMVKPYEIQQNTPKILYVSMAEPHGMGVGE